VTIGEKIKTLRKEKNMTQTDVAKQIGIATQTIFKYEKNIVTNIPLDNIEKLANLFNVSPAYLMGWGDEPATDYEKYGLKPIKTKKFPMLGEIACGQPIYANEDYETFIEASEDINADFCLTAKGDSMINARIFDGDVVFIREQPDVENGEIAAVQIEDEVTLKRVYKYENRLELRPENPTHKVLNYEGETLNHIRILGKAVVFQSKVI